MNTTTQPKPLGYWLAVVEDHTRNALRDAFADQGVSRREWRLLNVISESPVTLEELADALPRRGPAGKRHGLRHRPHAGELADRRGKTDRSDRSDQPTRPRLVEVVDALVERGWLASSDRKVAITEEGSRKTAEVGEHVSRVRERVGAGISDSDYATTVSTLEAMARNLGWTEESGRPRRRRRSLK